MIKYDRDAKHYLGDITDEQVADYEAQVRGLDNEDLLDCTVDLAAGDDWEGALTRHGTLVLQLMREELTFRLKAIGFLE